MSFRNIIDMGKEYLLIGGILVLFLVAAYLCIRYLMARHNNTEYKKVNLKRVLWWFVFLCYVFVVLGATMLSRDNGSNYNVPGTLFYSYRSAWVNWSVTAWRNNVLNILMFVPFGFLLPLGIKWFGKCFRTYTAGFLFSLFIELSQLIFKLGIFEWDDLFNNTLGAMVGFGLYAVFIKLFSKDKNLVKPAFVILTNTPLFMTVAAFVIIYAVYESMELGINANQCIKAYDTELLNVYGVEYTDDTAGTLPVYKNKILTKQEQRKRAEEFFLKVDGSFDINFESYYDGEAWFRSKVNGVDTQVIVKKRGGVTEYTNMDLYSEKSVLFSEEEVRGFLKQYGYEIDDDAVFMIIKNSQHLFKIRRIGEDQSITEGRIIVELTADKKLKRL
ncbi:MAG: VanZ family protein, partial [Lachnospiraceae bacterium]|nr:VanZ family protein [Lachnospiraceae bacterium]